MKSFALLLVGILLLGGIYPGKDLLKGEWYEEAALYDQEAGGKGCRIDSGNGNVLVIRQQVENPLFESSRENEAVLQIEWPHAVPLGQKTYFPNDSVKVCYREEGNLLMFETFEASGWILPMEQDKKKRLSGKVELKLVNPHHNFSNSDYHFIGGSFKALQQNIPLKSTHN